MFEDKDQVDEIDDLDNAPEDDAIDVVEEQSDEDMGEADAQDDADVDETEEPAGLVVSLDDEDGEDEPTPVIRTLRAKLKEQAKRLKELEAKAATGSVEPDQLGEKPTLESVDYDSGKFEAALLDWNEKKRKIDNAKEAEAARAAEFQRSYEERLQSYQKAKDALGARGFEDAEDAVRETLTTAQQSIIVANAKQPAILVYALGKNPDMMKELAGAPDLASFAYKLGQIEAGMKVTGMNKKPAPEKRLNGRSQAPASGSKKLEQLRLEAEKTGDYSKVTQFKKQLRSQ